MDKKQKRKVAKISIFITSVFIIFLSISYAFINQTVFGIKRHMITSGNLKIELEEEKELTIENAMPIYDEVGMIQESFNFRLVNYNKHGASYIVKLVDITAGEKLDAHLVKYGLIKEENQRIDYLSNIEDDIIDVGFIHGYETIHYSLRLWIDANVEDENLIKDKSLRYRVEVELSNAEEVELDLAGGVSEFHTSYIIHDQYANLPIPTKEGYNFLGWYDQSDNLITEGTIAIKKSKLTAKWAIKAYTITFDSNGGAVNPTTKKVEHDSIYGSLPTPTKLNYNFIGWYNESEQLVEENTKITNQDHKLVAKWEKVLYTVTLNANGGSVSTSSKKVAYGETIQSLPVPTKSECEFQGWYTATSGGTRVTESTTITSNQTIYAQYIYKESLLNGTNPVLSSNLVPVNIADNGTVTKADTGGEWYRYGNKRWANAVILVNKTSYSNGQTIPESNIQSYFVWIPRYKYKLFNMGNYTSLVTTTYAEHSQEIEIVFENKNTGITSGTKVGDYHSHPAFQAFNTNGFWVGKFETGDKSATNKTQAERSNKNSLDIVIKPNQYSWRNVDWGYAFVLSDSYLRSDESHLIKNTEWGAVAYLQRSKYGSNTSVRPNNKNNKNASNVKDGFQTGYAATSEPTCGPRLNDVSESCNVMGIAAVATQPYNTTAGYTASTTGNISGIYDMSGGAWEFVAAYNTSATTAWGSSGITSVQTDFATNTNYLKYYDRYTVTTANAYNKRILGDATGEMGPFKNVESADTVTRNIGSWYHDFGGFVTKEKPFLIRGGLWYQGSVAGIFAYSGHAGAANKNTSFRIVLTPQ